MGRILQGLFPKKLMRKFTRSPRPFSNLESAKDLTRPPGQKGNAMRLYTQNQIKNLALKGYGYKRIADILEISPNTVKSHLRRHPPTDGMSVCQFCGKPIEQNPGRKEKKYCSDKCRMAYWNSQKQE